MQIRFIILLLLSSFLNAATLKPESVQAWDHYLAVAEAKMAKRAQPNAVFLWIDESPERRQQAQSGEILVSETFSGVNKKAPGAMIHDWTGAAFIAGANIDEVLAVIRNYDKYADYYKPAVIHSKTVTRNSSNDRFSILLMNQSLVLKTALTSDYQSTFTQLSDTRWFGKTVATRIQEIDDFGHPDEHILPVGEGGGFLWRLASFTRFEERDGGVYVELEVMALSRDVPMSLRFIVDPIIRRVSRNSLTESLTQTGKAVGELRAANGGDSKAPREERNQGSPRLRPASSLGMAITNP
jgi:hypothetical protein